MNAPPSKTSGFAAAGFGCFSKRTSCTDLPIGGDAVGGESGSAHPMHARPGRCRAGPPFTLADAPAHCRRIWIRSRVHYEYDSLSCTQLNNLYLFDSRRTCFVQHLRIQSFTRTLLFVFVFVCSSSSSWRRRRRRRIRTHAIKPSRAAATFLFVLHRIVTILINGYSNAGHYNHKYDLQTTAEHENESRTLWQVTHFRIPYIFETSREVAIVTVIGRDWLPCIISLWKTSRTAEPIGQILNLFNIPRWPPYGLPMRPRQPIPCRETIHIGRTDSIGAQSGHRIG